jgi:hypothetical protein
MSDEIETKDSDLNVIKDRMFKPINNEVRCSYCCEMFDREYAIYSDIDFGWDWQFCSIECLDEFFH